MKVNSRIIALSVLLYYFTSTFVILAQNPPSNGIAGTVKTPMGQTVNVWINQDTEMNRAAMQQDIDDFSAQITNKKWKVYGVVGPTWGGGPTWAYQCHGYAWHMSNKTTYDPVEMNADLVKYFTNDAYVEIPALTTANWIEGVIIVYDGMAHSAVTTNEPGWVISKWRYASLFKHKVDECPWGGPNATKKYYKVAITGNDKICTNNGTANYTTKVIPGATYVWTAFNTPVGSNSSSINITNTFSPASGWIKVSIYSPLSGTTIKGWKRLCVGNPSGGYLNGASYDIWGSYNNSSVCPSSSYTINASLPCELENLNWTANNFSINYQSFSSMSFYTGYGGSSGVELQGTVIRCPETGTNCCFSPGANVVVVSTNVDTNSPYCNSWYMRVSPNPSADYIEIESGKENDKFVEGSDESYRLTIYNDMRIPVYEIKDNKTKKLKINTRQFANGIYIAQLVSGKEVISKRFIVNH